MTITLNYEQALDLLNRQVEKKGADYRYQKVEDRWGSQVCRNWHDGQPSCIVGHAFADLIGGVPAEESTYNATDTESAPLLANDLGYTLTYKSAALLVEAQRRQDVGEPWGLAVEHGRALAEHYSDDEVADRNVGDYLDLPPLDDES